MNKQEEERRVFDMAKQDVLFLKNLELVEHGDRPDFVLKDKCGRKIGLEHFRADVYRVQDKNSSHVSGGHTVLNDIKDRIYETYHPITANNLWTSESTESAAKAVFAFIKDSLDMQSHYTYGAFLDNIHVCIHGRSHKVKGHIQKSRNYPERDTYDLMGFLIEIPVPSFYYHFETIESQKISLIKSLLCPLDFRAFGIASRRYNNGCSYQKINGLPITNEIWKELYIFDDIDFIIIETYDAKYPREHHGQYFDRNTSRRQTYSAFSFGFTNMIFDDFQICYKDNKINTKFISKANFFSCDSMITRTKWKSKRREQDRKSRKLFNVAMNRNKYFRK